jgi:hypothetical protein
MCINDIFEEFRLAVVGEYWHSIGRSLVEVIAEYRTREARRLAEVMAEHWNIRSTLPGRRNNRVLAQ